MMADSTAVSESAYGRISSLAVRMGVSLIPEELAEIASKTDMGQAEFAAIEQIFAYLAEKREETVISTLLKLSRLPQKAPKTFEGFDFERIRGKDADALRNLPSLANLYARRNLAFIGPGGIGKTHLAQAYGRECCLKGYKTYFIKATELKERFARALANGDPARVVNMLVKPACLIIDEVGRCTFDRRATDLFFDVIDRRYEKDVPNTLVLTSNTPASQWDEFFTGDDTLLCTLDRIFDRATVFMMKGASYRGSELETFCVETVPQAMKMRG